MAGFWKQKEWLYVAIMIICIFISLPITPILWNTALRILGPNFNLLGYLISILVLVAMVAYALRRRLRFGVVHSLLLVGFALVYFYLLKYYCQFPSERLHLIEYGLLAYFLYRALNLNLSQPKAYLMSFLISSGFGFLDEGIQHILPNRVYETRDAMTNVAAAALGLLMVAVMERVIAYTHMRKERTGLA